MPVFRLEKVSSPCRVVFLSNLNGKGEGVISHNQAMLAGPPLNRKLTTALIGLRFNKYLLCFDLKKAFLQISLNEEDQQRLLFLWYKNVAEGDFSLVTYKNVRLSFGLRCSPTLLMLGLYKILMIDIDNDSEEIKDLKQQIYHLIYVDNGAITANTLSELEFKFKQLNRIFNPYQFELQQYVTNHTELQNAIDKKEEVDTEVSTKLLGVRWDRVKDELSTKAMKLNENANTKRQILKSIAENFDPEGYNLPVLNRARLFMHRLQLNQSLDWDTELGCELVREWKNICKQLNDGESLTIPRYIGDMTHKYDLIAFTDSSKELYGVVVYLYNKDLNTVSFIRGKNRVINRQLKTKTIPTLEFQGITFGSEVIIEVFNELTGPDCVDSINIENLIIYTDSYVALNWLNNYNEMQKLRNLTVFTINRLNKITKLAKVKPITFKFVAGFENPADFVTRELSERKLRSTNYITGPKFLTDSSKINSDMIEVRVPNRVAETSKIEKRIDQGPGLKASVGLAKLENNDIYTSQLERFSRFKSLINSYVGQLKFVNKLKQKLKNKSSKFSHFEIIPDHEIKSTALRLLIKHDQEIWYSDVLEYFAKGSNVPNKDIPSIVTQLNLSLDENGIIHVKSKFYPRFSKEQDYVYPVLISPKSRLAELMINEYHERLSHANRYTVLSEIRKKIWIPRVFCLIKKLTYKCLVCKRLNARTIQLNKNCYRPFRGEPEAVAFRNLFLDYVGPFEIRMDYTKKKDTKKVWILVVCCLWSRAVKLHLCYDYSAAEFTKAFQKQIFEFGLPTLCISDAGTPIVGGINKIKKYIFNNVVFQNFLKEQQIDYIEFSTYPKGNHELGGLIETINRMVRKLLFGSVRNLILDLSDMHYLLVKIGSILNKRPLVLKETLKSDNKFDVPELITPEMLVYGRSLSYLNIIPEVYTDPIINIDCSDVDFNKEFMKIQKLSKRLHGVYQDYFMQQLVIQSTNRKDMYKPRRHQVINIGDLVLIKDPFLKPHQYPLARVKDLVKNSLGEITEVTLVKSNKEVVQRHVASIIPLLCFNQDDVDESEDFTDTFPEANKKKIRKAAETSRQKTKNLFQDGKA